MLNVGQKVIVLSSTADKEKLGPCNNSVGYIVDVGRAYLIGNHLSACKVTIMFDYYGSSKKRLRAEKRTVINITDFRKVPTASRIDLSTSTIANNISKLGKSAKYYKDVIRPYVYEIKSIDMPFCVISPIINLTNLLECSNEEFSMWFNCYLLSVSFMENVTQILTDHMSSKFVPTKNISMSILEAMYDMYRNKDAKNRTLPIIVENKDYRKEALFTIRAIEAKFFLQGMQSTVNADFDRLSSVKDTTYRLLQYMYTPSVYNAIVNDIKNRTSSSSMERIIEEIPKMAKMIKEMGRVRSIGG